MSLRPVRLIEIPRILKSKDCVRASELAKTLKTSIRTIYRDIETLKEKGWNILGEQGVGYALRGKGKRKMLDPRSESLATKEYQKIKNLSAFNIESAESKKINQHVREYTFPDTSVLKIHKKGEAKVIHNGFVVIHGSLKTNAFGAQK